MFLFDLRLPMTYVLHLFYLKSLFYLHLWISCKDLPTKAYPHTVSNMAS
jgi:hypothetical protein